MVCLWWKMHLAYTATLQALHSNNKQKKIIHIKHSNRIKNPNCQEAKRLDIYKHG